jgi:hypothetical protein
MTKFVKIADKMEKVNDNFTVYRYENGYMLEISGRTKDNEWKASKIVAASIDDLNLLVKEALTIQLD